MTSRVSTAAGRVWGPGLRRRLLLLGLLATLSALPILFLMPLFGAPFERDQGLYGVIARGWLQGSVPYRDLWDNKGPVLFLWYMAAFKLLGEGVVAPRLLAALGTAAAVPFVLCSAVRHSGDDAVECDPTLMSQARALPRSRFSVVEGVGAASDAFVSGVDAKSELALELAATVVDMESYWIGRAAAAFNIPFLSVRAISDPLTARLPPLERFIDAEGRMNWRRLASHCVTKPRAIVGLLSLARDAHRASANLASYAFDLLPAIAGVETATQRPSKAVGRVLEERR